MPELTAVHVGIIAAMLVVGVILGWLFRGDRCAKEKIAINAGWQDQIESQQSEHSKFRNRVRSAGQTSVSEESLRALDCDLR